VAWVRERTIPTEQPPLVGEVSDNFADTGCHVVSVTDPYSRILGFLDRFDTLYICSFKRMISIADKLVVRIFKIASFNQFQN
jgi:hypothetical protein